MSNFKWKIFSNFVAFSEYPNFNGVQRGRKSSAQFFGPRGVDKSGLFADSLPLFLST